MCQLLGMNCNTPTDVTFSFSGIAQRGGVTDHHADGWDIAFFEGHGVRHFVDHQSASQSPMANLIRRYPFTQTTLSDEDVSVNFADVTPESDRVAVVVTSPLTTDEAWTALQPGRIYTFEDGDLKAPKPLIA
jgi:predicted glutamine amidotransferase